MITFSSVYLFVNHREKNQPKIEVFPPEHLPDIILTSGSEIIRFVHDNQTNTYNMTGTYALPNIIGIEGIGDNFIVNHDEGLVLLDQNLSMINEIQMKRPLDIGVSGEFIYACSNNSLYGISSDLQITDSIHLNTSEWAGGKDAHDILIHKGSAYLLDNVIEPIYVFKVNISDPYDLSMDLGFEISWVNQHLRYQWIDPDSGQWFILQHSCSQAGTYQYIRCYSCEDGSLLWVQETFYEFWIYDRPEEGFYINGVTESSSGWMLTSSNDDHHLRSYENGHTHVIIKKELDLRYDLPEHVFPHSGIEQRGNLLFISIYDQLVVVDVEKDPVIVLSQTIKEPIVDVCVIE
ncbi:MAG: hypothetical protein KAH57_10110 [Thermoplasmata archaeon]|nr:hypothetical protein [Thermoplasmata archaeon]